MKRAILLFGAGASLEYNAPATVNLTGSIEREVMADAVMKKIGGDTAFTTIKTQLESYLQNPGIVHFEHIYHCVHELMFTFPPTAGAADEFRPLLYPFITATSGIAKDTLSALAALMVKVIFSEVSAACGTNPIPLDPLVRFKEALGSDHITRIYTTNYDDFLLQAVPHLYTGFPSAPSITPKRFEIDSFWQKEDVSALFYLHGSVHMGFAAPTKATGDIGELFWFDDRTLALKHSSFSGSGERRMDGSSLLRTAIITGLDKLSRLQQRPLSHFYSAMARDMMRADVIYVVGSGLGDLHLNTWLKEARSRDPMPPILFVDYWPGDFLDYAEFETDNELIQMFHPLKIHMTRPGATRVGTAWTVSEDRTAAVWDKGFQAFLNVPSELKTVLGQL